MTDLAYMFPKFSILAVDARMKSFEKRYIIEDRAAFAEVACYYEQFAERERSELRSLYEEFSSVPGSPARAQAADVLDQCLDELEGRVHVPN